MISSCEEDILQSTATTFTKISYWCLKCQHIRVNDMVPYMPKHCMFFLIRNTTYLTLCPKNTSF